MLNLLRHVPIAKARAQGLPSLTERVMSVRALVGGFAGLRLVTTDSRESPVRLRVEKLADNLSRCNLTLRRLIRVLQNL